MSSVDVTLDPSWPVGDKPHGGYLLRTAVEHSLDPGHPHPLAVSAHYLSPPDPGPAVVEVERLRTGRRVSSSRVRLAQRPSGGGDAVTRVEALVSHSTLTGGEDHALVATVPSGVALPDGVTRIGLVRPGAGVRVIGWKPSSTGWDHFRAAERT